MPQKKSFFNVTVDSDKEVTIHIYGIIGLDEAYWDEGTNNVAFALVSLIRKYEQTYQRINIRINSPGGYIDDGLAIYNAIKFSKAETHTYNDGVTASMASDILLAGQVVHGPKTSIFHLHSASSVTRGNIKDHQETIKQLETYEDALCVGIAEKLGITKEEVKKRWFDGEEYFMTGEEAFDLGFFDVLEETNVQVPAGIENMTMQQIFNLYKTQGAPKNDKKQTVFNKMAKGIKSVLAIADADDNNQNNNNQQKIEKMKELTMLMALLALDYIVVNEDGKAVFDRAQAEKLNAEMERLSGFEKQVTELNAEKLNLEKDLKTATDSVAAKDEEIKNLTDSATEKDKEIADLKAKLEGKPAAKSTKTTDKSEGGSKTDDDGVDWETIDSLQHNVEADALED